MLRYRIENRCRRLIYRFLGEHAGGVVPVSVSNASLLERSYSGLIARTSIESAGISDVVPKSLAEDCSTTIRTFHVGCESVLLDITNTEFSFREHVLVDPCRKVLFSDGFSVDSILMFRHFLPSSCRRISGTVAYLSNTWVDNYYHWMQLTLPLLRFYQKLAPEVEIDAYYVGRSRLTKVQEETLAVFGVQKEQIIRDSCQADRMLVAFYTHQPQYDEMRYRDCWGHEFVRKALYQTPVANSPRRIYVRRGNVSNRRLINEQQVEAFLKTYGFVPVCMDGRAVAEQARLFAGADTIIGVHGAALTNLIFAHPGAKFIELFPPEAQEPGMFTAATHSGLDYYFLLGISSDSNHRGDFTVRQEKLQAVLKLAGI